MDLRAIYVAKFIVQITAAFHDTNDIIAHLLKNHRLFTVMCVHLHRAVPTTSEVICDESIISMSKQLIAMPNPNHQSTNNEILTKKKQAIFLSFLLTKT